MSQSNRFLAVVVLAAGRSSRMGRPKQLEVVDGEPMVVRAAGLALSCGAGTTIVITGAYQTEVELQLLSFVAERGLQIVHNAKWAEGQATSVHTALRALPESSEAVLFLPVDQPYLTPEFLQRVIQQWQQGAELVAPKVNGESRGAPAIFTRRYVPELLEITGDVGGRPVLMKHKNEVTWVDAEPAILRDIDTLEDLGNG